MKNRTKKKPSAAWSFLISGILSAIVFAVEGICAFAMNRMPICYLSYGGDCTEYIGIGWTITRIFPCVTSDEPVQSYYMVDFNPVTLIMFIVLIWIIVFAAGKIIAGRKVNW